MTARLTALGFLETSKTPLEAQLDAEAALERLRIARYRRKVRVENKRKRKAVAMKKKAKRTPRTMTKIKNKNRQRRATKQAATGGAVVNIRRRLSRLKINDGERKW